MIDQWLLPGPAGLVSGLVASLMDGRQIVVRSGRPLPGLRSAVESALEVRQRGMRIIFDDGQRSALDLLLLSVSETLSPAAGLPAGIYWVEGLDAHRSQGWIDALACIAEVERNKGLWDRRQLVLFLPTGTGMCRALDLEEFTGDAVGRLDLEVAARYAVASMGGAGIALLKGLLAVEMAASSLPDFAALDVLSYWLDAPDAVVGNPAAIVHHAPARHTGVLDLVEATLALLRAQQYALVGALERERLRIIAERRDLWRLPYNHPGPDGRPGRTVNVATALELSHLCAQASMNGVLPSHPLRRRLETLRSARNALSHLEPLSVAEVTELLELDGHPAALSEWR